MPAKIAASILSADLAHLADQVDLVTPYSGLIHVDAMDGHFVPPLSIGPVVVESLRKATDLPLHCHLMVDRPATLLKDFVEAGADIVTCHLEAVQDPARVLSELEALGSRAGLAISPQTPVDRVFRYLERLDRVLIMSVNPGWAGQEFIEGALPKIEAARGEIERLGLATEVEVDGGINEATASRCVAAGATVLAVASSIFKAPDPAEATRRLAAAAG